MKTIENIFLHGWIACMLILTVGYLLLILYFGGAFVFSLFVKSSTAENVSISNEPTSATFNGDTCTEDCSGHEAGYEWAKEHDITDPDDCGGKSQSFIEGCQSYAEEN